jgi:hypothetical protein
VVARAALGTLEEPSSSFGRDPRPVVCHSHLDCVVVDRRRDVDAWHVTTGVFDRVREEVPEDEPERPVSVDTRPLGNVDSNLGVWIEVVGLRRLCPDHPLEVRRLQFRIAVDGLHDDPHVSHDGLDVLAPPDDWLDVFVVLVRLRRQQRRVSVDHVDAVQHFVSNETVHVVDEVTLFTEVFRPETGLLGLDGLRDRPCLEDTDGQSEAGSERQRTTHPPDDSPQRRQTERQHRQHVHEQPHARTEETPPEDPSVALGWYVSACEVPCAVTDSGEKR